MNLWRLFFTGILLVILCACTAQQEVTTAPAPGSPEAPSTVEQKSVVQIPDMPCAEPVKTDTRAIRYPAENLYLSGAVLPREEGLACLEVLSDWLKSVPQSRWQVTVTTEEGHGFDPHAMASKRQELLQRFFTRKGVELKDWEWQTVNEKGLQLKLHLILENAGSDLL